MAKKLSMWSNPIFLLRVFYLEVSSLELLAQKAAGFGEPAAVFDNADAYLDYEAGFTAELEKLREEIGRTRIRLLQTKIADAIPDSWLVFPIHLATTPALAPGGKGHICIVDKTQIAVLKSVVDGINALSMRLRAKEEAATKSASKGTERNAGEADRLILATLSIYHKYSNCSVANPTPIVARNLSKMASVSPAAVSDFWKKRFRRGSDAGSYAAYKAACNNDTLAFLLGHLNGDVAPREMLPLSKERDADD